MKKIIYKDKKAEVLLRPDGMYNMTLDLSKEVAAKFYRACNLISEELGRPVSKAEALIHILEFAADSIEAEIVPSKKEKPTNK